VVEREIVHVLAGERVVGGYVGVVDEHEVREAEVLAAWKASRPPGSTG
jgi:hypothetical protein